MISTKLEAERNFKFEYSICTLVTDEIQYHEMLDSFISAGFTPPECEFLHADNTKQNEFDAYRAINRFLQEANGRFIIICHQDVLIEHDREPVLRKRLNELSSLDTSWGIAGNAGARNLFYTPMLITENGKLFNKGVLPSKVTSLDENFLVINAEANLAVSSDLSGFHLYGTDICLITECLGRSSYVVDFNITHKSSGKLDPSFREISKNLQRKYSKFFRGRYVKTTVTRFYLGSSWFAGFLNLPFVKTIVRLFQKFTS